MLKTLFLCRFWRVIEVRDHNVCVRYCGLEYMNYAGEFDSAAVLFAGSVVEYGIHIPRNVYAELLGCYSSNPLGTNYTP